MIVHRSLWKPRTRVTDLFHLSLLSHKVHALSVLSETQKDFLKSSKLKSSPKTKHEVRSTNSSTTFQNGGCLLTKNKPNKETPGQHSLIIHVLTYML